MKLLSIPLQSERDVVEARSRTRRLAELLHLNAQDQTRVATVVSELARYALGHAGSGMVELSVRIDRSPFVLCVRVSDHGPGRQQLPEALQGESGGDLSGSRRLMDAIRVEDGPAGGTVVSAEKQLPLTLGAADVRRALAQAGGSRPPDPLRELQVQNQELLSTLEVLAEREERLRVLNQELEDTNRGVVALYGELEEKAERLREANQLKTMFLSYMSHEFRTPLNSILGLTRMLLARLDGDLGEEQHKQVTLVQGAAGDLLQMVNDLLDVAKVEAGKTEVHVATFEVGQLFGTLRALFLPLASNPAVRLVFEEPQGVPPVTSDEGKVAQILRNYIANALKFTEEGEVRVSATLSRDGQAVRFAVRDTGVGVSDEDQARLFQDFTQLSSPLVTRQVGTGLGLSLARKLSELLGGRVGVRSEPGRGSTFYSVLPLRFGGQPAEADAGPQAAPAPGSAPVVLVVDDNEADRYLLSSLLAKERFEVRQATGGRNGLQEARAERYHAVFLDLSMPDLNGLAVLRELRADPATRELPVLIVTSQVMDEAELEQLRSLGASVHSKERLYRGETTELVTAAWNSVRRVGRE